MNNRLSYKNFKAKIEFSADDNVFVGRIVGIDDIVMFESKDVEGLKKAFHEAVDFHIEVCQKIGKKLKKSYNGKLLFRFSNDLHAQIAEAAQKRGKSINAFAKEVFQEVVNSSH